MHHYLRNIEPIRLPEPMSKEELAAIEIRNRKIEAEEQAEGAYSFDDFIRLLTDLIRIA